MRAGKTFSSAPNYAEKHVCWTPQTVNSMEIKVIVAVQYDNDWWLAFEVDPKGPNSSFAFPRIPNMFVIPFCVVLCLLNVTVYK